MRANTYARDWRSTTMESMPQRCSISESSMPAGPAPTMTTFVRIKDARGGTSPAHNLGGAPFSGTDKHDRRSARISWGGSAECRCAFLGALRFQGALHNHPKVPQSRIGDNSNHFRGLGGQNQLLL